MVRGLLWGGGGSAQAVPQNTVARGSGQSTRECAPASECECESDHVLSDSVSCDSVTFGVYFFVLS